MSPRIPRVLLVIVIREESVSLTIRSLRANLAANIARLHREALLPPCKQISLCNRRVRSFSSKFTSLMRYLDASLFKEILSQNRTEIENDI